MPLTPGNLSRSSVLLVTLLIASVGCADEFTPTLAQNTSPLPAVSAVVIEVDSSSLAPGHTTQARIRALDGTGSIVSLVGQTTSWKSLTPTVATVSASGLVTAVAAGTANIQAVVGDIAGNKAIVVTVPAPPTTSDTSSVPIVGGTADLVWSDFSAGTLGSFTNPWGDGVNVIDDPTGSGRGKVVDIHYSLSAAGSTERAIAYTSPVHQRYGQTIWMKGDLYIPASTTSQGATDNRKLIDYQGHGVRMTLHRVAANDLRLSIVDWMNGSEQEVIAESTGIVIPNNQWTTIEVKMVTNSADNVRDGVLEIYINGASAPSYRRTTGLGWITEKFAGGSYFNTYLIGFQLSSASALSEERYWDNVGFATHRITK